MGGNEWIAHRQQRLLYCARLLVPQFCVQTFSYEYKSRFNEEIPYQAMGFESVRDLIEQICIVEDRGGGLYGIREPRDIGGMTIQSQLIAVVKELRKPFDSQDIANHFIRRYPNIHWQFGLPDFNSFLKSFPEIESLTYVPVREMAAPPPYGCGDAAFFKEQVLRVASYLRQPFGAGELNAKFQELFNLTEIHTYFGCQSLDEFLKTFPELRHLQGDVFQLYRRYFMDRWNRIGNISPIPLPPTPPSTPPPPMPAVFRDLILGTNQTTLPSAAAVQNTMPLSSIPLPPMPPSHIPAVYMEFLSETTRKTPPSVAHTAPPAPIKSTAPVSSESRAEPSSKRKLPESGLEASESTKKIKIEPEEVVEFEDESKEDLQKRLKLPQKAKIVGNVAPEAVRKEPVVAKTVANGFAIPEVVPVAPPSQQPPSFDYCLLKILRDDKSLKQPFTREELEDHLRKNCPFYSTLPANLDLIFHPEAVYKGKGYFWSSWYRVAQMKTGKKSSRTGETSVIAAEQPKPAPEATRGSDFWGVPERLDQPPNAPAGCNATIQLIVPQLPPGFSSYRQWIEERCRNSPGILPNPEEKRLLRHMVRDLAKDLVQPFKSYHFMDRINRAYACNVPEFYRKFGYSHVHDFLVSFREVSKTKAGYAVDLYSSDSVYVDEASKKKKKAKSKKKKKNSVQERLLQKQNGETASPVDLSKGSTVAPKDPLDSSETLANQAEKKLEEGEIDDDEDVEEPLFVDVGVNQPLPDVPLFTRTKVFRSAFGKWMRVRYQTTSKEPLTPDEYEILLRVIREIAKVLPNPFKPKEFRDRFVAWCRGLRCSNKKFGFPTLPEFLRNFKEVSNRGDRYEVEPFQYFVPPKRIVFDKETLLREIQTAEAALLKNLAKESAAATTSPPESSGIPLDSVETQLEEGEIDSEILEEPISTEGTVLPVEPLPNAILFAPLKEFRCYFGKWIQKRYIMEAEPFSPEEYQIYLRAIREVAKVIPNPFKPMQFQQRFSRWCLGLRQVYKRFGFECLTALLKSFKEVSYDKNKLSVIPFKYFLPKEPVVDGEALTLDIRNAEVAILKSLADESVEVTNRPIDSSEIVDLEEDSMENGEIASDGESEIKVIEDPVQKTGGGEIAPTVAHNLNESSDQEGHRSCNEGDCEILEASVDVVSTALPQPVEVVDSPVVVQPPNAVLVSEAAPGPLRPEAMDSGQTKQSPPLATLQPQPLPVAIFHPKHAFFGQFVTSILDEAAGRGEDTDKLISQVMEVLTSREKT